MEEQAKQGHTVGMLYPAGYRLRRKAAVRRSTKDNITSYAFYSRNLVPLVFGVSDPDALDCSDDGAAYEWLLDDFHPDVIHVHSIQGIGERFFHLAKERGVRMVLTTHDYYPLCLRCNMMDVTGSLCGGPSPERCARCNKGAGLTAKKNAVMQSPAYRNLKGSRLARRARAKAKASVAVRGEFADVTAGDVRAFSWALASHQRIVGMMDIIHANSELAERVYRTVFSDAKYRVLPITHAGLNFKKVEKSFHSPLRIGYVGGANEYKGYRVLLEALKGLEIDWRLDFYGTPLGDGDWHDDRIVCHGSYPPEKCNEVFSEMDVLVVPSIWPETFGFVVIEALSQGTLVVCSDCLGSSGMLPNKLVYPKDNYKKLSDILINISDNSNTYRVSSETNFCFDMTQHVKTIDTLYL